MIKMPAVILGCLLVVSACAQKPSYRANSDLIFVGALMVFYDSEAPLSYQTLTTQEMPKDAILLGEVEGDSCQQGLSIPIFFSPTNWVSVSGAKGNGSFKKALLDIESTSRYSRTASRPHRPIRCQGRYPPEVLFNDLQKRMYDRDRAGI
jgi:hypothetical protein